MRSCLEDNIKPENSQYTELPSSGSTAQENSVSLHIQAYSPGGLFYGFLARLFTAAAPDDCTALSAFPLNADEIQPEEAMPAEEPVLPLFGGRVLFEHHAAEFNIEAVGDFFALCSE